MHVIRNYHTSTNLKENSSDLESFDISPYLMNTIAHCFLKQI